MSDSENNAMKILIIEDEARIAKRIERMITAVVGADNVSISMRDSLESGKAFIKSNEIDVLFLDLNLNGENGFEVLKKVVSDKFHTIVVSAYKDKAITAFEYGVLDFVPKPFSEDRLADAFARIKEEGSGDKSLKYLSVNMKGVKRLIKVSDILFVKGADVYSEIHCMDGKEYLHSMSLDHLCEILPSHFERIHRSHIANMQKAKNTISEPGSRYFLELEGNDPLPIGRTKYKVIREKWFL